MKASTGDRGYGHAHRKARQAALAQLRDGDPCARCGRAMYHGQALDLDHTENRDGYRGLAHAHCNRAAGAVKGNRARAGRSVQWAWRSRSW